MTDSFSIFKENGYTSEGNNWKYLLPCLGYSYRKQKCLCFLLKNNILLIIMRNIFSEVVKDHFFSFKGKKYYFKGNNSDTDKLIIRLMGGTLASICVYIYIYIYFFFFTGGLRF